MYKITIEHTRIEELVIGNEWTRVAEDENGKSVYGHTPEEVRKKTVCRKIYEQTVNEIDMAGVVKVINGIEDKS